MLTIYLAGAIRDNHPEDIQWREWLISKIQHHHALDVRILNPLGDKTYSESTGEWKMGGTFAGSKEIYNQDFWCVQQADLIIANYGAFADKYPMIGTVMETGMAVGLGGKLIYAVLDPGTNFGVENRANFTLHPFLENSASQIFASMDDLWAFLETHLDMLTGTNPRFGGVNV